MAGNFQRLEFGAMWLIALAGVGVTLMTTGFRLIGLGLTAMGLLLFLHRFWGDLRRAQIVLSPGDGEETYGKPSAEFLWALLIIPATALIAVYIFFSSSPPSQVVSDNRSSEEPTTAEQSVSLRKYVCTTTLPAESGKHALLVEFGVRRGQTNGFVGEVHLTVPYVKNDTWIGTPLRTEKQRVVAMKIDHNTWETSDHLSYAERFMSPIITPRLSYYVYFEAEQPLGVKSLFFIEDPFALSDQLKTNILAKEVEACPR